MRNRNNYSSIVLEVFLVVLAVAMVAVWWWFVREYNAQTHAHVACTLEAKLCPDGSYVGRAGPNCEFAACPTTNTNTSTNTNASVVCTAEVKSCPDGSYVSRVPPSCEFAMCPTAIIGGYVVENGSTTYTNTEHGFRFTISGTYVCNAVNCPQTGDEMGLGRDHIDVYVAKLGTAATPRAWLKAAGADDPKLVITDTTLGGVVAASADGTNLSSGVSLHWEGVTSGSNKPLFLPKGKITVAFKDGKAYVVKFSVGLDASPDSSRYDEAVQAFTFTDQTAAKDWKTYTNENSLYSIRYPNDWTYSPNSHGNPSMFYDPRAQLQTRDTDLLIGSKVEIYYSENNSPTVSEAVTQIDEESTSTPLTAVPTTLDGQPALRRTVRSSFGGTFLNQLFALFGGKLFTFVQYIVEDARVEEYSNVFDQMIPTFTFTK